MSVSTDLYDQDFARWAETQARILRDAAEAGTNVPVDWQNVAEEIESLARTDRRALRSHLETIIEHLLKLQFAPAVEPRRGWRETVRKARDAVDDLLNESPSLRPEIPKLVDAIRHRAVLTALAGLAAYGERQASQDAERFGGSYDDWQVTEAWFPPEPVT